MNRGKVEDEMKSKVDKIMNEMKQKWIRKYPENSSEKSEVIDTQDNGLGNLIMST